MKKLVLLTVLICLTVSILWAIVPEPPLPLPAIRANDARVMAMGGAFTAVADDADALFYNPAGLVFLDGADLNVGMTMLVDTNANLVDMATYDFSDFNLWDLQIADGTVMAGGVPVDLVSYGFENSWDGIEAMRSWYDGLIPLLDGLNTGVDQLRFTPNISFANNGFGIGMLGGVVVKPAMIEYPEASGTYMEYGFEIAKRSGLIAGMGFGFGRLSLGANLKYFRESRTRFGLPTDSYIDFEQYVNSFGLSPSVQESLIEIFIDDAIAVDATLEDHIEMGVGGMYVLGGLTVGAYVDSILGIVVDEQGGLKNDFRAMLEAAARTANIGISFDPSMQKVTGREPFFNLLISADLKNIGDDYQRFLNLGTEVGIHIGELAQVDLRAGYKQYLTGPIMHIMNQDIIALDRGEVSFGAGVKALFAQVDVAATVPARLIRDAVLFAATDTFPQDGVLYLKEYGPNFPRIMISFGINL